LRFSEIRFPLFEGISALFWCESVAVQSVIWEEPLQSIALFDVIYALPLFTQ
jgi:hypothetical protein